METSEFINMWRTYKKELSEEEHASKYTDEDEVSGP